MSRTATAPAIEISANCEVLLIVLELGEMKWKVGFSSGFGQDVLERNIDSRDTAALMKEIERARGALGLGEAARMVSCYEAGRDGFWLHRFLEGQGIENLIVDSASIETSRKSRRAKTDRLDLGSLMDLLARHLAGSREPVWSVVNVPSIEDEDRRHLHRELKLAKQDRNRVSNRIKGLLANNGLTIDRRKNIPDQIQRKRLWDGSPIPEGLQARLERYAADYDYYTHRIAELEAERRERIRDGEDGAAEKVRQLCLLRGVGSNTAWLYVMEFFGCVGSETGNKWVRWPDSHPLRKTAGHGSVSKVSARTGVAISAAAPSSSPGAGYASSPTAICLHGMNDASAPEASDCEKSASSPWQGSSWSPCGDTWRPV